MSVSYSTSTICCFKAESLLPKVNIASCQQHLRHWHRDSHTLLKWQPEAITSTQGCLRWNYMLEFRQLKQVHSRYTAHFLPWEKVPALYSTNYSISSVNQIRDVHMLGKEHFGVSKPCQCGRKSCMPQNLQLKAHRLKFCHTWST